MFNVISSFLRRTIRFSCIHHMLQLNETKKTAGVCWGHQHWVDTDWVDTDWVDTAVDIQLGAADGRFRQTQGADTSHKPNLCFPLLSLKPMICSKLHFSQKQDTLCLSSLASRCLQHKLDWWSDSLLIRLILQSTCAQETETGCFIWRTGGVLINPDSITSEQWPHEDREKGSISRFARRGVSDRSNPGDMQMVKQGQVHGRFTFSSASGETNQFPSL